MINFAWRVTDFFFTFLFPCILNLTLYLRIFCVAQQQVKVINSQMKGGKCVLDGSVKRKSENKAAVTLGIIVVIHLLCYLPIYIFSLTGDAVIPSTTANFLTWTMYVNSGLNPVIYALFYSWFRKSLKHILSLRIFQVASSLVDIFTDHH
ncbi:Trace amine-associated receptor 13c [Labeo rohita]|uniref:Trace amine-associated receptor 13c n=2 Tax=Labeo rohita TaxID=84645 RepID=A0ABQ8MBL6_LABRO|nr:Trace amine-associated receptor 13c [Labeo rohita]